MTIVVLHLVDTVTDSMIAAVAVVEAGDVMTHTATVALVTIVVTEAMADVIVTMVTHHVVLTAMPEVVMTATEAVVEMTDVAVAADIPTVMTVEEIEEETVEETAMVDAHPEMQLHQPPMAIQLLVGSQTDHTEVDTMARETPVAIDR
jgi:hypothetical protein